MMALDYMVSSGFQPTRSFYVAFGHDEEVSQIRREGKAKGNEERPRRGSKKLKWRRERNENWKERMKEKDRKGLYYEQKQR